ncbi:cytochrome oxidase assembly protein [Natrarchaeobius chitinivorans]|uniref:Cytochrome oxidase assembly protein n=1 Tax=Natrarchaeobius chitinivorans TaxID=1679083 RepID=A0A3N6MKH4_NATCH|nr:cytochrome oxidase assembly protein [Natrarchaeobius chitinivorans]RQG97720.1 cytochrome oxidase assembly protein [Natrarchaeobius chitinivorans]
MSSDSTTGGSRVRQLIARVGFPHLLATTLALVAATILLGVAAKATGSGLACEANWPQCDAGPYNLFPANLPSFYEWFHRFVAMFAGFAIIGSAVAAWRNPGVDARVATLVVLGMVLTPIQVVLGRETVLQYEMTILSLHFWTAVLIFVLFVVATVLVWRSALTRRHVTGALVLGTAALPLHVALSPLVLTDITDYSPSVQMAQYGVTLALLAAVIVAVMVGRWRLEDDRLVGLLVGAAGLALVVVFLGRRAVMTLNPALDYLYLLLSAILFVTFVVGIRLTRGASSRTPKAGSR